MAKKKLIVAIVIIAVVYATGYAAKKCNEKIELPKAVKAAIKALYPAGQITKAEVEKKCIKFYEVKVDANGINAEVTADADGAIVTVETKEKTNALPPAVAKTVASKGGKIVEAEKKIIHARLKLVKLDSPVTRYEVKVEKKGKTIELKIADDGKILKEEEKKKGKEEHKED